MSADNPDYIRQIVFRRPDGESKTGGLAEPLHVLYRVSHVVIGVSVKKTHQGSWVP